MLLSESEVYCLVFLSLSGIAKIKMNKTNFLITDSQKFLLKNWVSFTKRPSRKYLGSKILTSSQYNKESLDHFEVSILRLRDELLIELKEQVARMNKLAKSIDKAIEYGAFADLAVDCRVTIEEIAYSSRQATLIHSELSKYLRCEEVFESSSIVEVYKVVDDFKKTSRYFSADLSPSTNIQTHIKIATKKYKKLSHLYDYFSELTHPNYGRNLIKFHAHSYSFDNVDSDTFVKDMIEVVFDVLEYQGSEYSIYEKLFLTSEYILKRVVSDGTKTFVPTELDYFWHGSSQDEAINFIFIYNPLQQINAQYKLMKGVWGLDLSGKRKSLYEEGPFKYDRWHINFLKNIWFQVDHFPISDYLFDFKNSEESDVSINDHLLVKLASRNLDSYRSVSL